MHTHRRAFDSGAAAAAEAALQACPPRHTCSFTFVHPQTKLVTNYELDLKAGTYADVC
jgi:hypothetical protein